MKIAVIIARILLGLPFLIFGLNNFFHFMPMQPIPGDAGVLVDDYVHAWMADLPWPAVCDCRACCCWLGAMCRWRL